MIYSDILQDNRERELTREANPGAPDANPQKFHPRGSGETPAHRGSLSTSFYVKWTDVEQDMANAVKTKMQFFNSSGNRGHCL